MPWIIDYPIVLDRMRELKLRSVYFNSGAFGFAVGEGVQIVGWLGPDDPTIRPDLPAKLIRVAEPYESSLSRKLCQTWAKSLDGPAWLMPAAHWAYELDFGHGNWLGPLLESIDIDPGLLQDRPNGSAIEFASKDREKFERVIESLLLHLTASDFKIVFPHHRHLVTIHHHKQIWWQTTDETLAQRLSDVEDVGR